MSRVSKAYNRFIDSYLSYSLLIDFLLVVIIWALATYTPLFKISLADSDNQINVISSIINTCVALAGFILAALTIIVTFKANLKSKGINEPDNALELLFSTTHYFAIVRVFKKAIAELVVIFILLYVVWCMADNFNIMILNRINGVSIFLLAIILLRSLSVLFIVLDMEKPRS